MSWRAVRVEREWEQTAYELWEHLGSPEPPIDPLKLCARLGLRVAQGQASASDSGSFLLPSERVVYLDPALSDAQRSFAAAHEAVHTLFPDEKNERRINYITMATLLPREHFASLVRETWCLWKLGDALAPHLSPEVIARRLLSLEERAAVSVWREGKLLGALRSPGLRYSRACTAEHQLAQQLFQDREIDRVDSSARGYAVADDTAAGRFVVTVLERECGMVD